MGKKSMVVLCAVVAVLSLITVILGIAGAVFTAQSLVRKDGGRIGRPYCEYQTTPAVGCGVVAALLALMTQTVVGAAAGCCGCCRTWGFPSETRRLVAIILSTFSWVLAIIVVILFFVAAMLIIGGDISPTDDGKCVPPGISVFAVATILFLVALAFQIISYTMLLRVTAVVGITQEEGIAMVKPEQLVLLNADRRQTAVDGDPPPGVPTVTPKWGVDPTSKI